MDVIYTNLNEIKKSEKPLSACIGYFDGLHRGHQQLVQAAIKQGNANNIASALITFHPDPWCVIKGITDIEHITSLEERIELAESFGIEKFIVLEFTKELAELTPKAFEENILQAMGVAVLVCGFDFHYGQKGQGSVDTLKKQNNFKVVVVDEVDYLDEKISSTRIEAAIKQGDMNLVSMMLGRHYSLNGIVKKGNQLGRAYGFPTANLMLNEQYVMPKRGVYCGYVHALEKKYAAIINIGHNPTFNLQQEMRIEAHLLNFNDDLYEKNIKVEFVDWLRDEQKFESKEVLIEQLNKDLKRAEKLPL